MNNISKYFKEDYEPIRCTGCESEDIREDVKNTVNGIIAEVLFSCGDCKKDLGYWAYGSFDKMFIREFLNFYD